jgi:hypothetical protein
MRTPGRHRSASGRHSFRSARQTHFPIRKSDMPTWPRSDWVGIRSAFVQVGTDDPSETNSAAAAALFAAAATAAATEHVSRPEIQAIRREDR